MYLDKPNETYHQKKEKIYKSFKKALLELSFNFMQDCMTSP